MSELGWPRCEPEVWRPNGNEPLVTVRVGRRVGIRFENLATFQWAQAISLELSSASELLAVAASASGDRWLGAMSGNEP